MLLDAAVVGTLDVEDEAQGVFGEADVALFEDLAATLTNLYD